MSGRRTPTFLVSFVFRLRAAPWGTQRSRAAAARTFFRVSWRTALLPFRTREIVATESPVARATSRIVTPSLLAGRVRSASGAAVARYARIVLCNRLHSKLAPALVIVKASVQWRVPCYA